MCSLWFTELIPMGITALLPIMLFPLFGIVDSSTICTEYMRESVIVFWASLVLSTAVEESNLHKRIALQAISIFGTEPKNILFGFMGITMFLSMWISNTATTALIVPIVDAVIQLWQDSDEEQALELTMTTSDDTDAAAAGSAATGQVTPSTQMTRRSSFVRPSPRVTRTYNDDFKQLRRFILLGICYSSNIGGTGTLVGTGTNLIFYGIASRDFPSVSFASWMIFAVPGMLICVLLSWFFITSCLIRGDTVTLNGNSEKIKSMIKDKLSKLGKITYHEIMVIILFVCLIALWFFRSPQFMDGWVKLMLSPGVSVSYIRDSCPAIFIVMLFFMIPADFSNIERSPSLIKWSSMVHSIPWGTVFLLGGGLALASGIRKSGLSAILADFLNNMLTGCHPILVQVIACTIALTLTEVASNATTATILLSILDNVARSIGINPLQIMLPVTLCCSYAFVLPVASPPNAIIFEAGDMRSKDMVLPGLFMKFVCLFVTIFFTNYWGPLTIF